MEGDSHLRIEAGKFIKQKKLVAVTEKKESAI